MIISYGTTLPAPPAVVNSMLYFPDLHKGDGTGADLLSLGRTESVSTVPCLQTALAKCLMLLLSVREWASALGKGQHPRLDAETSKE